MKSEYLERYFELRDGIERDISSEVFKGDKDFIKFHEYMDKRINQERIEMINL